MIRSLIILTICLLVGNTTTEGSGTYNPPNSPYESTLFSVQDIQKGQRLYERKNGPTDNPSCASCHNRGEAHVLRRSRLKKITKDLRTLIKRCMTIPERGGYTTLTSDTTLVHLGIYLIARYRLPHSSLGYLKKENTQSETSNESKAAQ